MTASISIGSALSATRFSSACMASMKAAGSFLYTRSDTAWRKTSGAIVPQADSLSGSSPRMRAFSSIFKFCAS